MLLAAVAETPTTYEVSGIDQWCGSKTADWVALVKMLVVISLLGFIEPSSGVVFANRTVGFFLMLLLSAPEPPGTPPLLKLLSSLWFAPPLSKKFIGPVMHDIPDSAAACLNDCAMIEVK